MSERPLPVATPTRAEIDAGWVAVKKGLERHGALRWRWAWVLTAVVLFAGVTAGATVAVREIRERVRAERQRREVHQGGEPAAPATPADESAAGSTSPVVPAADENAAADSGPGDAPHTVSRMQAQGETSVGQRGAAEASGDPGSRGRDASGPSSATRGRGYTPLAGMSPKPTVPQANGPEPAREARGVDTFAEGSAARARGDFGAALTLYERFVSEHPGDERAGIAAIEAARILADHLDQPAKALGWAERAVTLSAGGSVREDARARVVQLLGTLRRPRCETAQREFLRDYSNSVHTERVRRACGEAP